ncbi:MAG: hypothetical protein LBT00_09135 [Spirochaetaceae bacterium]|nr:hypothetical protein [Spirochaetaceae bacterium]
MTRLPRRCGQALRHCGEALRHCERLLRHCERSEAIQCEHLSRLDCFTSGNCVAAVSQ